MRRVGAGLRTSNLPPPHTQVWQIALAWYAVELLPQPPTTDLPTGVGRSAELVTLTLDEGTGSASSETVGGPRSIWRRRGPVVDESGTVMLKGSTARAMADIMTEVWGEGGGFEAARVEGLSVDEGPPILLLIPFRQQLQLKIWLLTWVNALLAPPPPPPAEPLEKPPTPPPEPVVEHRGMLEKVGALLVPASGPWTGAETRFGRKLNFTKENEAPPAALSYVPHPCWPWPAPHTRSHLKLLPPGGHVAG